MAGIGGLFDESDQAFPSPPRPRRRDPHDTHFVMHDRYGNLYAANKKAKANGKSSPHILMLVADADQGRLLRSCHCRYVRAAKQYTVGQRHIPTLGLGP